MSEDRFAERKESLGCESELTAFNVAAVAEAMDTVRSLEGTKAGLETIQTRQGGWKSWDPDVYGVDEATEGGYIKRLEELGRPVIMLSEESDRVEINLDADGEPMYCVSDPFDGSWLFKRQLPLWWYSSLAFFAKDFTPLSTATGDVNQNVIAFADPKGAYLVTSRGNRLTDVQVLDEAYRRSLAGEAPGDLSGACIESYGLKPKKFLRPLLEQYGELIYSFKMYYPNGGPFGFVDVATGQVDVYFAVQQPYVDVFSGLDVAVKSGAVVTDFDGNPFALQTDDCRTQYDVIASRNRQIHDQVLQKLASCR
ncbi:MAG: FIG domain-containing protein [Planctomycetota bacterium]|jgi:fructose-1,6-bisphosphatase/inositol monophosphatase family enzyme